MCLQVLSKNCTSCVFCYWHIDDVDHWNSIEWNCLILLGYNIRQSYSPLFYDYYEIYHKNSYIIIMKLTNHFMYLLFEWIIELFQKNKIYSISYFYEYISPLFRIYAVMIAIIFELYNRYLDEDVVMHFAVWLLLSYKPGWHCNANTVLMINYYLPKRQIGVT